MSSSYEQHLIEKVMECSNANIWDDAIMEWDIVDCEEDESLNAECVCGKENLKYLYTVVNRYNRNMLYPIGSSCIRKFGREDLDEIINIQEDFFKLYRAIRNRAFISLTSDFFSRKLLRFLFEDGAFPANQYNRNDGYSDYIFMLNMFNKRNKEDITLGQHKKIRGIIVESIRPYLRDKLDGKIR